MSVIRQTIATLKQSFVQNVRIVVNMTEQAADETSDSFCILDPRCLILTLIYGVEFKMAQRFWTMNSDLLKTAVIGTGAFKHRRIMRAPAASRFFLSHFVSNNL
jgi:hypothetical protein